jgi:calcium-dependent protein kinase
VSSDAKDLITKMLRYDARDRPVCSELLKHPWFDTANKETACQEIRLIVLKNLAGFYSDCLLQKAVLIYFVNFFDISDEKNRLLQVFKDLDKDHDGQISKSDLLSAYRRFSNRPLLDCEVDEILISLDFNQNEFIDFGEFLVANVNYIQNLNKTKLKQIFDIIDTDKSGFLTINDLKKFLNIGDNQNEAFTSQMIAELGTIKNGAISFDEFDDIMDGFIKRIQSDIFI